MTLIAVPNISEGRNAQAVARCISALEDERGLVLDLHADKVHNRSVITLIAPRLHLPSALARLAETAAASIDLAEHEGVHPWLGALDVCPIVPVGEPMDGAVEMARWTGRAINDLTGLPIYFYGHAARRPETAELPAIRAGGLARLRRRAKSELPPDIGDPEIDPHKGIVCVGARGPLIAFNVWLRAHADVARSIANSVRGPNVRALGLEIDKDLSQVSLNLIDPTQVGIETAYGQVARSAERLGALPPVATEIVGLVEERFLPGPDARAARLLLQPSRSLESALES
jgi:glutamate formiminotransferase